MVFRTRIIVFLVNIGLIIKGSNKNKVFLIQHLNVAIYVFSTFYKKKYTFVLFYAKFKRISMERNGFFSSIPPVTLNIIIINVIAWFATIVLRKSGIDLINLFGLHFPGAADFHFYQFLTYMFLHAIPSFGHIFFNMFAVFMFGRTLEMVWGPKRYLTYYLITGLGAAIVQVIVWYFTVSSFASSHGMSVIQLLQADPSVNYLVTIGASGAVFGILLAFGVMFPNIPLYIMFIPVPVKAKYFVIGYGVLELFLGVSNFRGDNVAHFAHLGGMLFGMILLFIWKKKKKSNVNFH